MEMYTNPYKLHNTVADQYILHILHQLLNRKEIIPWHDCYNDTATNMLGNAKFLKIDKGN